MIRKIIIHYSETPPTMDIGVNEIRDWHVKDNGWKDVGYHTIIKRNGKKEYGRPFYVSGAHTLNNNKNSIAICWIGGRGRNDNGVTVNGIDNRTPEQKQSLIEAIREVCEWIQCQEGFTGLIEIGGHKDYQPIKTIKGVEVENLCPGLNTKQEYQYIIDEYNEKIKN
jgi:N-acetylmuramoyl-L-alanine amidase